LCAYILLHEPVVSTVTPFMDVASIVSLRDLSNLIFFFCFFCVVFLKLRKFCKPYHNFEEKTTNFVWPIYLFFVERLVTIWLVSGFGRYFVT